MLFAIFHHKWSSMEIFSLIYKSHDVLILCHLHVVQTIVDEVLHDNISVVWCMEIMSIQRHVLGMPFF